MDLLRFHSVRSAIQVSASPGKADELLAVESRLRGLLMASGLFEQVEVEHTGDPNQLVIALCEFKSQYTEREVADRLEEIWADRVRYPFWEAHVIRTDEAHVEFEAASRSSQEGHYVTVHLVALKAEVPSQRAPSN